MRHFAVVVAVQNEADNIAILFERLKSVFKNIPESTFEFWVVDDGSADNTYNNVIALAKYNSEINLVKLSRNFGHHNALFAGMEQVEKADFYITMDGDLQHRPEDIPKLLNKLESGFDMVYATRKNHKVSSRLFWYLVNTLSKHDIAKDQLIFRIFNNKVYKAVGSLGDYQKFFVGIFSWVGFKAIGIEVEHPKRYSGKSKYNFFKQMSQALDAVTGFSIQPLRFITFGGLIVSLFACVAGLFLFGLRAFSSPPAGWTFIMTTIFFALGIQMISLGIIAEYIGKLFSQAQNRPYYIVDEIIYGTDKGNEFKK